ncbi:MAG: peptide deformylase [Muribaculaceae bacterium]|nr:peptide deformylase [Muribaculaceae bacterium]MDE6486492.1 peptide deformylase [Muribaculaceae bacterium]
MKLPVYLYGHPVLRKTAEPVAPGREGLKDLLDNMFETMYASEGVGLAAPQVGLSEQIVVIDADPLGENFPECAGRKFVLINPEIEILDGEPVTRAEGCLSLPGLSENVRRTEHIRLRWLDADFTPREEEISGFLARIVQHECDHLQGKVYIDHISPIRKQLIRAKLNNIVSGRIRCDYPVKYAPRRK